MVSRAVVDSRLPEHACSLQFGKLLLGYAEEVRADHARVFSEKWCSAYLRWCAQQLVRWRGMSKRSQNGVFEASQQAATLQLWIDLDDLTGVLYHPGGNTDVLQGA